MILHCLDRKFNRSKFPAESIHDVDSKKGIFEVEKASGYKYKINFGRDTTDQMPLINVYFTLPQKQWVSIQSAAEGVRITLKEIGTLTYACPTADDLLHLDEQLKKSSQTSTSRKSCLLWKD